jgi:hypothetical protein
MSGFGRQLSNPADQDPLNRRVNAALTGTLDELSEEGFEFWPKEQVKEAIVGLQREDSNKIAQDANADAFLALHPEFVDIDSNGKTMNRTLEALYGERVYTVSEFEKAYQVCCANNSLTLDEAEIVKQQQSAANLRAKAERARRAAENRVFSEDDKYNMSLEELRQVENNELQKRLQLAGERGGNGF